MSYGIDVFTVLATDAYTTWFSALRDRSVQLRITARIKRLMQGNLGDVKGVGGGVSEMRLDFGPGYRLYFTRRGLEIIVLLCAGDKSSQSKDIKAAQAIAAILEEE